MKEFDEYIPSRSFDDLQFVNFTDIMMKNVPPNRKETKFAIAVLMEIPTQYKATIKLNILGRRGISHRRVALPPPVHVAPSFSSSKPSHSIGFQEPQPYYVYKMPLLPLFLIMHQLM